MGTGRVFFASGLGQPGFQALLALARSGCAAVQLSGYQKFSVGTAQERLWDTPCRLFGFGR